VWLVMKLGCLAYQVPTTRPSSPCTAGLESLAAGWGRTSLFSVARFSCGVGRELTRCLMEIMESRWCVMSDALVFICMVGIQTAALHTSTSANHALPVSNTKKYSTTQWYISLSLPPSRTHNPQMQFRPVHPRSCFAQVRHSGSLQC
jgi:hypothetical protein